MWRGIFIWIGLTLCNVAPAAAQEDPGFAGLAALALTDPPAAILSTSAALAAESQKPAPDRRLQFDLGRLRADLVARSGKTLEAAQAFAELASFATTFRAETGANPAPLWSEAVRLFEMAGEPDAAFEAQQALVAEYRDGARPPAVIAEALEKLAALAEELAIPSEAARYRANAATLRDPDTLKSQGTRGADEGFHSVDVFYATDRARSGVSDPAEFYGSGRGDLERGIATVTIPHNHTPGVLEAPSVWRLEFRADPAKHVVLQSVTPLGPDDFYGRMQGKFAAQPEREALVFVHGYNVSFDQAARRAAQLAFDMRYVGVPILYSWPSRGSTVGYVADTAVVRLSARRLTHFLDEVVERSGAQVIHLVAHSMGNRALTDALELMALRHGVTAADPPIFGQVVFAAPDVDAGLFRAMLPTIRPLAKRLTLYASEEDWALTASRRLHGDIPRAGLGGKFTLRDEHVDSIDMSELGEDMLAHSYFADDSSALADMMTLFWQNTNPARRCGLTPENSGVVPVWQYQRGICADRNLIELLGHMRREGVTSAAQARDVLGRTVKDQAVLQKLEPVVAAIIPD